MVVRTFDLSYTASIDSQGGVSLFILEKDGSKFGVYLRELISNRYESIRKFCRAYLELRDGETDDEEIRKLLNRFSQILKGTKRIQIDDLPYVTELLDISCEELLSAGTARIPVSSHVTNYDVAFSHDRLEWDKYMNREDKLFLNCDEYCKTVIDYALDFKNYEFIKYLLDEKYIWLVDLSNWTDSGFSYGAGTSIKRRDIGSIDMGTPLELQYQDKLRTRIIALAIESKDYDVLDALLAREVPSLHLANMSGFPAVDIKSFRNNEMIKAVAKADDQIVDYFSQEFTVKNIQGRENAFLYPYLNEVLEAMLADGNTLKAELVVRRALKHNKKTLERINTLLAEAVKFYQDRWPYDPFTSEAVARQQALERFRFDVGSGMVSYYYFPQEHKRNGFVTNIFRVEIASGSSLVQELLDELNQTYDEIVSTKEAG